MVELKDAAVRRWMLLVALTGLLSALVVPVFAAATITPQPASGVAGSRIVVNGTGFSPNAKVTLYWERGRWDCAGP